MDNFMISFIIFIVAIFFSRKIIEKANKKLDQEKKAALIDVFSRDRIWTYGMLLGLIILFFITLRFSLIDPLWAYLIYIFLLISYVIMMAYYSYKKLKTNDFPSFYIQSYVLSLSLRLIGLLIFIALLNV